MSSVIFLILTKCGITGQRVRDKERQHKADRTEGGQSKREITKSSPAGEKEDKKGKGEICEDDRTKDELRSFHR